MPAGTPPIESAATSNTVHSGELKPSMHAAAPSPIPSAIIALPARRTWPANSPQLVDCQPLAFRT